MARRKQHWFSSAAYKKVTTRLDVNQLRAATGLDAKTLNNYRNGSQPGDMSRQADKSIKGTAAELTAKRRLAIGLLKLKATHEQLIEVGYTPDELRAIVFAAARDMYGTFLSKDSLQTFELDSSLEMFCRAEFDNDELVQAGYDEIEIVIMRDRLSGARGSNAISAITHTAAYPVKPEQNVAVDDGKGLKPPSTQNRESTLDEHLEGLEAALRTAIEANWKSKWSNQ